MAELARLDDKLGEVLGLARAARNLTGHVGRGIDDRDIVRTLKGIRGESAETARRCDAVVAERDGRKTAIRTRARATSKQARAMMDTYLADDDDPVRALEFLAIAEAEETSHLEILGSLALAAGDEEILAFVEWARPVQERHLADARNAGLVLAAQTDPEELAAQV